MSGQYKVDGEVMGWEDAIARAKQIHVETGVFVTIEQVKTIVTFKLDIEVHDLAQLHRAAAHSMTKRGDPHLETLLDEKGKPNIRACLIEILDPGSLEGCGILQSDVVDIEPDPDGA